MTMADAKCEESAAKKAKTSGRKDIGATWGLPEGGPCPKPKPGETISAPMTYQGDDVPRSLVATGQVRTHRDGSGSDGEYVGCDFVKRTVEVRNGRDRTFTLDDHGFTLVADPRQHVDYMDNSVILREYYPACCELVKRVTGAKEVFAFDHNVRSKALSESGKQIAGGSAVQGPAFVVHNDYTSTSAPRRVRDLAQTPKVNDTLRQLLGDRPLIDPSRVDALLKGRWMLVNVWRNIKETPVQKMPLAMCEGPSVPVQDIVTFEIHYADRVGENYFAVNSERHKWNYFPEMTRDEAVLLKVWDSAGAAFAENASAEGSEGTPRKTVPASFSFHTAFEDPSSHPDADDRESIEIRTVVFF